MKSLAKAVGVVMVLTVLSRFMALVSQAIYLAEFGVNVQMDAYSFAITIPNVIFAGVGTALTTVVVPIFANHFGKGEKGRGFEFIRNIMTLAILVTAIIAFLGILFTPVIISLTSFAQNEAREFAIFAVRSMFTVMMFYALAYIFQGVLQSSGRFVVASMICLPGSLIVIAYTYFLSGRFGITGLVIATLVGLSFQVIIMIPSMIKIGFDFKLRLNLKDEDIKKALRLIPPVFIGTSAWQVNMLFNSTVASWFEGGATLITLVQNLVTSGVLTFIFSITAVIFPRFTVLYGKGEKEQFKDLFSKSIGTVLFFLIPLAIGFILMGESFLAIIYGRGQVTPENIKMASIIMGFYGVGIIGNSLKEITDRAFYAMKDTLRPALNGLLIMIINIVSCIILIIPFGVYGIPFGYTISLTFGGIFVLLMLRRKIGDWGIANVISTLGKTLVSSVVMGFFVFITKTMVSQFVIGDTFLERLIVLGVPTICGMIIYFVCAMQLRMNEARNILEKFKTKLGLGGF